MTLTTQAAVTHDGLRSASGEPDPDAVAVACSVCEQVRPLQAYLFGSRARGDYDSDSDVDIAIITAEPIPEERQLTIDRIARQAATSLHPGSPAADVSFLTAEEFFAGRVKKNTLANSIAKEGTLIMNGSATGYDGESEEETVNWDDVAARVTSAQEAVTDLDVLVSSARSSERMVGYTAQQALEHAYKALIAAHGGRYPTGGRDGHNLRILITRVQETMGPEFQVPGADWQSLTTYAGAGRYQDEQQPLGDRQRLFREISVAVAVIINYIPPRP